jgi:hypothetical protein
MEQQALRTATTAAINHRIQDVTRRIFFGPPTRFGGGNPVLKQRLLSMTEVGRVRFARIHAPRLPDVVHRRQVF